MSQRTDKVASLIQRSVAAGLNRLPEAACLTVTSVDVSPDLRHATVRIGVVASRPEQATQLFKMIEANRRPLQDEVARSLSTKFVPQLSFEHDTGAEHANHISKLIRGE